MRNQLSQEKVKLVLAIGVVLLLAFLIIKGLWTYIGAFFGTAVLYVLFSKLNDYLEEKTFLRRKGAAFITILISLLIIIIPAFFIISTAIGQVSGTIGNPENIISSINSIDEKLPWIDLTGFMKDQLPKVSEFIANALFNSIKDVTRIAIALAITYFLLYFLLIEDKKKLRKEIVKLIPFNKQNSEELIKEFKTITNATVITTGLMALLQGFILTIIFIIFNIKAAVFWGLVGAFLSFLPVVGPALIWVPVVIMELMQGRIAPAIIITIGGIIIAYIDNLIRPFLNRKIGRINQVVSLLGIFMGLILFGIIGVIIGPIIISFFLLTLKMFNEEYLKQ